MAVMRSNNATAVFRPNSHARLTPLPRPKTAHARALSSATSEDGTAHAPDLITELLDSSNSTDNSALAMKPLMNASAA